MIDSGIPWSFLSPSVYSFSFAYMYYQNKLSGMKAPSCPYSHKLDFISAFVSLSVRLRVNVYQKKKIEPRPLHWIKNMHIYIRKRKREKECYLRYHSFSKKKNEIKSKEHYVNEEMKRNVSKRDIMERRKENR
jgi:hypothetical protein